jgi:hypothetical protein
LRDHHDRYDEADHGADSFALIEIADDGAAHHHAGGPAQCLEEARGDQLWQVVREDAGNACRDHQCETRQQHRATAELVRQRAHDELRTGDANHVERHRHLRDRDVAPECRRKHGERRNQHIERDWRNAGHGDEQEQHHA